MSENDQNEEQFLQIISHDLWVLYLEYHNRETNIGGPKTKTKYKCPPH